MSTQPAAIPTDHKSAEVNDIILTIAQTKIDIDKLDNKRNIISCLYTAGALLIMITIGFTFAYYKMIHTIAANNQIQQINSIVSNYTIYNAYCTDIYDHQYICYHGDVIIGKYCIFNKIARDDYNDVLQYLTATYPLHSAYVINYDTQTSVCRDRDSTAGIVFVTWFLCASMIGIVIVSAVVMYPEVVKWRKIQQVARN